MDVYTIAQTDTTPLVELDFAANHLRIAGESMPGSANAFYAPAWQKLREHLATLSGQAISVNINLVFFNSGTAKQLAALFDLLETAVAGGNTVAVEWCFIEGDEMYEEFGQNFEEDFPSLNFRFVSCAAPE